MSQMASDDVARLPPKEINTLPILLVPKLPRHPPDLPYDTAQRNAPKHTRKHVWARLRSRCQYLDKFNAGLDPRFEEQRSYCALVLEALAGDIPY